MLETELAYFEAHKTELLKQYAEQFVLIKGDKLIGAYPAEAIAYAEGLKKFGNQPMLIKKVVKDQEAANVPALTLGLLDADT